MLDVHYTVPYLLIMGTAFLISYLLTPLIYKFALGRKQFPASLGSISIYLAFILSIVILTFWLKPGHWASDQFKRELLNFEAIYGILIGGGLIFLIGLISDIKKLSPLTILFSQVLSAMILALFGINATVHHLPVIFNIILTILWVILIVNAFSIISVKAGLSEGLAIIATIPLFVIGWRNNDPKVILPCCVLASATFGFLRYSFPPSRSSLGKAGSMFLGFVIAAVALAENYTKRNMMGSNLIAFIIAPLFIFAIPLYDTAVKLLKTKLTIFRSKKQFAPLETSFLTGFTQRLADIGFSTREALIVTYSVAFVLGIVAVLVTYSSLIWVFSLSLWVGVPFIGLLSRLNQSPVKSLSGYVHEVKRVIFEGGLSESKTPSDVKNILRSDLRLATWLLADVVLVNMGIYISYLIRFNGVINPEAFQPYLQLWYFLTAAHLAIFALFKLYYHPNNFSKIEVITRSIKAVTLSTMASVCIVYIYRAATGAFPSRVFASAEVINIILIGGWRIFIRYEA